MLALLIGSLALGVAIDLFHIKPAFHFGSVPWGDELGIAALIFVAAWWLITVQLWVAVRWRSFTVAVSVGIVGTVANFFALRTHISQFRVTRFLH
jgi:lantibiotic transport system permease protein